MSEAARATPAAAEKAATEKAAPAARPERRPVPRTPVEPRRSELPAAQDLPSIDAGSSEDLFAQIKNRLAEAERQAALYGQARTALDELAAELAELQSESEGRLAESEAALEAATHVLATSEREKTEALEALGSLKAKLRQLVSD